MYKTVKVLEKRNIFLVLANILVFKNVLYLEFNFYSEYP